MVEILTETRIQVGWFLREIETNSTFEIKEIDSYSAHLIMVNLQSNKRHQLPVSSLHKVINNCPAYYYAPSVEDLAEKVSNHQPLIAILDEPGQSQKRLEAADYQIAYVQEVEEILEGKRKLAHRFGRKFKKTEELIKLCEQSAGKYVKSTYHKYRKNINDHGGDRFSMAVDMRSARFGKLLLEPSQVHLLETYVFEFLNRTNPITQSAFYTILENVLQRTNKLWVDPVKCIDGIPPENLVEDLVVKKIPIAVLLDNPDYEPLFSKIKLPSKRTVDKYVADSIYDPDLEDRYIRLYGRPYVEQHLMVYESFIHNALYALHYVFIDHWFIDLYILDDEEHPIRLWLTLIIDAYTRCILGYSLSEDDPCTESVTDALECAIWTKDHILEKYGFDKLWVCFGIPRLVSLDNALPHHGRTLEELPPLLSNVRRRDPVTKQIITESKYPQMILAFRRPYRGRYGAIIERLFGTFAGKMRQMLRGAIPETSPKSLRESAKKAVFNFEDLEEWVVEMILAYQHTPHKGLDDMTPHEKWMQCVQKLGLPEVPPKTPDLERAFWRLVTVTRPILGEGISLFGMKYTSDDLHNLPRKRQDKNVQYGLRCQRANIRTLAVYLDGEYQCDVHDKKHLLPDGKPRPLSFEAREMAQRESKRLYGTVVNWEEIVDKWDERGELRGKEKASRERARKKQAKGQKKETLQDADKVHASQVEPPMSEADYEKYMAALLSRSRS